MLYAGVSLKKAPWTAPLLLDGLADTLPENVENCASGLAQLNHKPAVPKLVELMKKAPTDPKKGFPRPYRYIGQTIAKLTGQEFDFKQEIRCQGNAHFRAYVVRRRPDVYRKETARLLQWWEDIGSKQKW